MIKVGLRSEIAPLAAALLIVGFSSIAADAQYGGGNVPGQRPRVGNGPLMETSDMKQKVTLPQLPEYAGQAKFVCGFKHESIYGPNYVQQYYCKETPKEVADWYRTALRNYSWSITSDENTTIMARSKDGSTCQIIANPHFEKNIKTQLMISYHEFHSPPPGKGTQSSTQ